MLWGRGGCPPRHLRGKRVPSVEEETPQSDLRNVTCKSRLASVLATFGNRLVSNGSLGWRGGADEEREAGEGRHLKRLVKAKTIRA